MTESLARWDFWGRSWRLMWPRLNIAIPLTQSISSASLTNSLASLHLYSYVASLGCSRFGCNIDDFSLPGASQGGVSPDGWPSWWLWWTVQMKLRLGPASVTFQTVPWRLQVKPPPHLQILNSQHKVVSTKCLLWPRCCSKQTYI